MTPLVFVPAERMYGEEEVYEILEQAMEDCYEQELETHYCGDYKNLKEWFEQFKKTKDEQKTDYTS